MLKLLILIALISVQPQQIKERSRIISVGEKADLFKLEDVITGEMIDMKDYMGKRVILLNFFTTWCGRCNWETKGMNKVYLEYKDKVYFFRINLMESRDKVKKFVEKYNIPFPVLLDPDGKVSRLYGVKYVPANIIIGKDGIVKFTGGLLTESDLRQRLIEVLKMQ